MKFRKKPVEIEAMQFAGSHSDLHAVYQWVASNIHGSIDPATQQPVSIDPVNRALLIHTLEGTMQAKLGDWIIRGVQGEFYPCKPDIFAETYEACE